MADALLNALRSAHGGVNDSALFRHFVKAFGRVGEPISRESFCHVVSHIVLEARLPGSPKAAAQELAAHFAWGEEGEACDAGAFCIAAAFRDPANQLLVGFLRRAVTRQLSRGSAEAYADAAHAALAVAWAAPASPRPLSATDVRNLCDSVLRVRLSDAVDPRTLRDHLLRSSSRAGVTDSSPSRVDVVRFLDDLTHDLFKPHVSPSCSFDDVEEEAAAAAASASSGPAATAAGIRTAPAAAADADGDAAVWFAVARQAAHEPVLRKAGLVPAHGDSLDEGTAAGPAVGRARLWALPRDAAARLSATDLHRLHTMCRGSGVVASTPVDSVIAPCLSGFERLCAVPAECSVVGRAALEAADYMEVALLPDGATLFGRPRTAADSTSIRVSCDLYVTSASCPVRDRRAVASAVGVCSLPESLMPPSLQWDGSRHDVIDDHHKLVAAVPVPATSVPAGYMRMWLPAGTWSTASPTAGSSKGSTTTKCLWYSAVVSTDMLPVVRDVAAAEQRLRPPRSIVGSLVVDVAAAAQLRMPKGTPASLAAADDLQLRASAVWEVGGLRLVQSGHSDQAVDPGEASTAPPPSVADITSAAVTAVADGVAAAASDGAMKAAHQPAPSEPEPTSAEAFEGATAATSAVDPDVTAQPVSTAPTVATSAAIPKHPVVALEDVWRWEPTLAARVRTASTTAAAPGAHDASLPHDPADHHGSLLALNVSLLAPGSIDGAAAERACSRLLEESHIKITLVATSTALQAEATIGTVTIPAVAALGCISVDGGLHLPDSHTSALKWYTVTSELLPTRPRGDCCLAFTWRSGRHVTVLQPRPTASAAVDQPLQAGDAWPPTPVTVAPAPATPVCDAVEPPLPPSLVPFVLPEGLNTLELSPRQACTITAMATLVAGDAVALHVVTALLVHMDSAQAGVLSLSSARRVLSAAGAAGHCGLMAAFLSLVQAISVGHTMDPGAVEVDAMAIVHLLGLPVSAMYHAIYGDFGLCRKRSSHKLLKAALLGARLRHELRRVVARHQQRQQRADSGTSSETAEQGATSIVDFIARRMRADASVSGTAVPSTLRALAATLASVGVLASESDLSALAPTAVDGPAMRPEDVLIGLFSWTMLQDERASVVDTLPAHAVATRRLQDAEAAMRKLGPVAAGPASAAARCSEPLHVSENVTASPAGVVGAQRVVNTQLLLSDDALTGIAMRLQLHMHALLEPAAVPAAFVRDTFALLASTCASDGDAAMLSARRFAHAATSCSLPVSRTECFLVVAKLRHAVDGLPLQASDVAAAFKSVSQLLFPEKPAGDSPTRCTHPELCNTPFGVTMQSPVPALAADTSLGAADALEASPLAENVPPARVGGAGIDSAPIDDRHVTCGACGFVGLQSASLACVMCDELLDGAGAATARMCLACGCSNIAAALSCIACGCGFPFVHPPAPASVSLLPLQEQPVNRLLSVTSSVLKDSVWTTRTQRPGVEPAGGLSLATSATDPWRGGGSGTRPMMRGGAVTAWRR